MSGEVVLITTSWHDENRSIEAAVEYERNLY